MAQGFCDLAGLSFFGDGHGISGFVLDGVEEGCEIDIARLRRAVRRVSGEGAVNDIRILGGISRKTTYGGRLTLMFDGNEEGERQNPALLRPSTDDYSRAARFGLEGGRPPSIESLWPAAAAAGEVARQIIGQTHGIIVGSHLAVAGRVRDTLFDPVDISPLVLEGLDAEEYPMISKKSLAELKEEIREAAASGETLGAVIECAALMVPPGVGTPPGMALNGLAARLIFSLCGACGVEFGLGFDGGRLLGTRAVDPFVISGGRVATRNNHSGGVDGGITNGMPVVLRAAFLPSPAIGQSVDTVDMSVMDRAVIKSRRPDTLGAIKMGVLVEGCLSLCLMSLL